jgi:hypothetical protein
MISTINQRDLDTRSMGKGFAGFKPTKATTHNDYMFFFRHHLLT